MNLQPIDTTDPFVVVSVKASEVPDNGQALIDAAHDQSIPPSGDETVYMRVTAPQADPRAIGFAGTISMLNGKPGIQIVWGGESGTIEPHELRTLAHSMLKAAEEADHDATVFRALVKHDFGKQGAVALLQVIQLERRLHESQFIEDDEALEVEVPAKKLIIP